MLNIPSNDSLVNKLTLIHNLTGSLGLDDKVCEPSTTVSIYQ